MQTPKQRRSIDVKHVNCQSNNLKIKTGKHTKKALKVAKMDTNSLAYRTLVFKHASANGYFSLSVPNDQVKQIYPTCQPDTLITSYSINEHSLSTFLEDEPTHNIDVTPQLEFMRKLQIST
ncbi:MAG: hypothetical protein BGO21_07690 [Dyadobacter sp. 50-39]|nr:MAG: hypothetical protein BGO21_07690 [Dyadobacter sp. 50-39]